MTMEMAKMSSLCDNCATVGCIFQTGIERKECAFYKNKNDVIKRQNAIDAIMREPTDAHYPSWYADRIKALPSAEAEKPNMKSWDGLYIKVYADDDPQDKAEKLYQICDSNEALSEVAKCIQWYLDKPSADYERATDQMEHDIAYEPTYNPEDGSM